MVNEVEQNTVGTIKIQYSRPKFHRRVLANLIDLIVFGFVGLCMFLLTRYIVGTTPQYQTTMNEWINMQLDSGLYVKNDSGKIVNVVSYIDGNNSYSNASKANAAEAAINTFLAYIDDYIPADKYTSMVDEYDQKRLDAKDGENNLFVVDLITGDIVKNPDYFDNHTWLYKDFYFEYINRTFNGYLVSSNRYASLTKQINTYLMWVEIPVAIVSSTILTYFVPTLFFRRGRKTLGKALYQIGTVDSRFLSPSFGRNLAKWSIFLVEMILGVVSLGVVFIASFTMMAFSKNRQGFPDYMLGLQEVDTSRNKIYYNLVEVELENASSYKKPTDFKLIDNP